MGRFRDVIAPVALCVALAGVSGCDKGGGQSEPAPAAAGHGQNAAQGPKEPAEAAAKTAEAAEGGEEQKKGDQGALGLGEGTDEQRALMVKAKKAFLTDQTVRAEALFKTLAETGPLSGPQVSAMIALAQIYNESGRSDKALALYDQLSERVADVPEVQLVVARAYADQGESTKAINAYKKLLKLQPDYVFALLELGELYSQAGRKEAATKTLYKYEKKVYALAKKLEAPDTSAGERIRILDIFSLVSDDRATAATVKSLGAESPQVRQKAAIVLGETGAIEAKKVLEHTATDDPYLGARMAAKDALKRLDKLGVEAKSDDGIGPKVVDDAKQLPE